MDKAVLEPLIISSLISYPEKFDEFSRIIKPYHLSNGYSELYTELIDLRNANEIIEFEKLAIRVQYDKGLTNLLLNVIAPVNPTPNIISYIPELEHSYKINRQRQIAKMLTDKADDGISVDIDDIMAYAKDAPHEFRNFKQWAEYIQNLPVLPRYQTGVSFLDMAFGGGIEMSQLVLLSGEPEAGKTSIGVQILENVSQGFKAAFFCFEFTARQYITAKLQQDPKFCENENLFIINEGYNINEVAENIRALHKMGVKFFLIDSQMRIEVSKARSMEEEESAKFSTLAKLAHSLEIVIMLIVQTAKGDPNNPMGSKKGGHESSITIRIEHIKPSADDKKNMEYDPTKRLLIIKKNKQTGKHFKEEVAFDPITRRFKRVYLTQAKPQIKDFEE
ncbi:MULTISPECIES: ATPase domain-containing protein [unclassified Campylobacter]|uniref:ATPase domain-containing protein n=1 Tax=unclassified Campylobacter TaxID=2593542 RepID=UPI003D358DF7